MLAGAGVIAVAGAAVVLWPRSEAEATPVPLPVVTVQADPAVELPYTLTSTSNCPAFSFRSPVESRTSEMTVLQSGEAKVSFNVVCVPTDSFDSLDQLLAWKMAHRDDSHLVGQPVDEVGPSARFVRTELDMGHGGHVTEWFAEREGKFVIAGYLHKDSDLEFAEPLVEAMVASWEWR